MNVIHYKADSKSSIVFVIVDRTNNYVVGMVKESIKNIADCTISNICSKNYNVLVGLDEDQLLNAATNLNFKIAVVLSTGTEFINGWSFFNLVEEVANKNFFIAGHILDRVDAYYELHHQCYVINLEKFHQIGRPKVGVEELGSKHVQLSPIRSVENIHDDYTPTWITTGKEIKEYRHKLHGWNILSKGFEANFVFLIFDKLFRESKKYYYPENYKEFLNHISWAISRERYCLTEFVHTENTELVNIDEGEFDNIITPASGLWFIPLLSKTKNTTVVMYDYNQKSLDFWRTNVPQLENVFYKFIKIDLLGIDDCSILFKDLQGKTLLNLSNIFCYEGTCLSSSLSYRLNKENELLKKIPKDFYVIFSRRSATGFCQLEYKGKNIMPMSINDLIKPIWHANLDWQD